MCDVLSDIDTDLNPSEKSDCNDPSAANLILASLQSLGDAALTAQHAGQDGRIYWNYIALVSQ